MLMPQPFNELRQARLQKLEKFKKLGFNPFSQPKIIREPVGGLLEKTLETEASVAGRLRAIRAHGGSTFADLVDESGKIQLFFSLSELGQKTYEHLSLLDLGDFIVATGQLFKTAAGELTLRVKSFSILTKSLRPLPSDFYGLRDKEEIYRQRYVDLLINPDSKSVFEVRSLVVGELRRLLKAEGFLEVETPVLQPIYGGATAKPFVTHHESLDLNLYLRISDELYLKRLIVGGFEKVYEIGKDFRNEGIDREHNPEFTMLEFYWAYSDYEKLMCFTEELLSKTVEKVLGKPMVDFEGNVIDFTPPWPRLTFHDAIIKYTGLDVDRVRSFEEAVRFIKESGLKIDLEGVVGYAPLLDELYKKLVRPHLFGPLFLVDHPYEMKPLAKRKEDDESKAASFQLLIAGREMVNAYNELNDPIDQRSRWEKEAEMNKEGLAEYQVLDEDYIRALEYGMPPTAGWGMGVDRFVSVLTGRHTLKDVILFPTLRPEGAPISSVIANEVKQSITSSNDAEIAVGRTPRNDKEGGTKLPLEPVGDFPSREKVFQIVSSHIKNQNLLRHCLAVEAAMRALARKFGGNEEAWGALGLIHDADWEETKAEPSRHTMAALEWLSGEGRREGPVVQGLKSHNRRHTNLSEIQSNMEWALECCDELTGFIVSVALVRPDKKISSVEVESVLKKWKSKEFAAGVDRRQIEQCEEKLGIKLAEFIEIVLKAMKGIASQIGL
ncbi:MAG: lysine--tRNA ligase [Patescibacteria group bacterium]|nr:lysine--tRNA ligase [Patescibacteria group bacterium]